MKEIIKKKCFFIANWLDGIYIAGDWADFLILVSLISFY